MAEEVVGARATPPTPALRLLIAGRVWTVPCASVVAVTEVETPTPLPLPLPGLVGLVAVNGEPVVCVDPTGPPSCGGGGLVVVVATAVGPLALRVDDARWGRDAELDADALDSALRLPWCGGLRRAIPRAVRTRATRSPGWPLLRVMHDGGLLALRAERLERIERAEPLAPLPDSVGWLVAVAGAVLPARRLSGPTIRSGDHGGLHAVVLRGDAPGERVALLVERAVSVEHGPPESLLSVRHPDGGQSLWWRVTEGVPLRVVDPAPLFGWPPTAAPLAETASVPPSSGDRRLDPARCLLVERAGAVVAIPLGLVAGVAESGWEGSADRLRLAGPGRWRRHPLRVDRIHALPDASGPDASGLGSPGNAVGDHAAEPWRAIGGLPMPWAALFDAARCDPTTGRWILRVRTAPDVGTAPLPWSQRRCLVAFWRDWIAPPPPSADAQAALRPLASPPPLP
ncbi:hypothetical protein [Azospirillum griseum]|uniref:hypothetical protein n=1 Tax=Azospirillum griseum TaxID=2496639 RepID=UPI00131528BF|nr:hypothetical protein [Azospirillum griseum]